MTAAWSEAAIPDLSGGMAVVTGASGGIGLEVARGLAARRARVVLAVRSVGRASPRPRRSGRPALPRRLR